MKLTIESTTKMVTLDGVPARIWEGHSEDGVAVQVFVTGIQADASADLSRFARELEEHRAPSAEVLAIPARLVL